MQIAAKINKIIRELGLKELGQLEQDLVFGDAGTKEVINFLRTKPVRNLLFKINVCKSCIFAYIYEFTFLVCRMWHVKISYAFWWFMPQFTLRSLRVTKLQNWWRYHYLTPSTPFYLLTFKQCKCHKFYALLV